MYDQFLPLLQEQGMSEKEALIYLNTLSLGSAPASTIARKTWIKRVTTYAILKDLERQQIALSLDKWWTTYFQVIEPTRLLAKMKQQYETFEQKVPELMALVQSYTNKPRVQYFEGFEGVKEMYEDLLSTQEPIRAFLGTSSTDDQLLQYLYNDFLPRRVAQWIKAYVLVPNDEKSSQYADWDRLYLKETKIIRHKAFAVTTEINLYWPNKVALALFTSDEMSAIVIHSKQLYESLLSIFSVLWASADA